MHRWNLKHVSVYTAAIAVIAVYSFVISYITLDPNIIQIFQKFLFGVPILFIIAAFLAFKIAEPRIVLIALSFLVLSVSNPLTQIISTFSSTELRTGPVGLLLSPDKWIDFLNILPFILPFTLSLVFLIPEKIGKFSMSGIKTALSLFPLIYIFSPESFEPILGNTHLDGGVLLWPSIAASILPLAAPLLRGRSSGTFSAALSSALILSLLQKIISLESYLEETSFLFAGIILLHSLYRVYWENSYMDELTGLFNRRALDQKLRRLRRRYALSMVDIDHFKHFNDTYGHDEGDNVLRLVSRILYDHFGKSAYRYGGEEFCIIFISTDANAAASKMDEARAAIEDHMFSIRRSINKRKKSERKKSAVKVEKVKLTVSAGIAEPVKSTRDAAAVLKNADKALYIAKEAGRNRVEISRINK